MLWSTLATAVLLPPCELLKSDHSWLMPVPSAVPIKTSNFTATFVRVVQNPQHEVKSVDSVRMTWSCMAKFGKYHGRQITTDILHMGATSKLVQWYQVSNFGDTTMHREKTGKTKSEEHASSFHFQSSFGYPLHYNRLCNISTMPQCQVYKIKSNFCNEVTIVYREHSLIGYDAFV